MNKIDEFLNRVNNGEIPISEVELLLDKYNLNRIQNEEFELVVDYCKTREEMIKVANFNQVRAEFNDKSFPFPKELSGKTIAVKARLFNFANDGYMETKDAVRKINDAGFRLGTLFELLALTENYPNLQNRFSVIALGSQNQSSNARFNSPFTNTRGECHNVRCIDCLIHNDRADSSNRYLAIKN